MIFDIPDRITLNAISGPDRESWRDRSDVEKWVDGLTKLGFCQAGFYEVKEFQGFILNLFVLPNEYIFSIIYTSGFTPASMELVVQYEDNCTLSITTSSDFDSLPKSHGHKKVFCRKKEPEELLFIFQQHVDDRKRKIVTTSNISSIYEECYYQQEAFRENKLNDVPLDQQVPTEFVVSELDSPSEKTIIDWVELEERLFRLVVYETKAFAQTHQQEVFYGYGFDCNANYGDVLLCVNTEEALFKRARKYGKYSEGEKGSVKEWASDLRWSFGDWKYQGFNLESGKWQSEWGDVNLLIEKAVTGLAYNDMREITEQFMDMACRVLLRLERQNILACFLQSPDFRIVCADHDEDINHGDKRLELVRQKNS